MSFDKLFDITAGVYFLFYNTIDYTTEHNLMTVQAFLLSEFLATASLSILITAVNTVLFPTLLFYQVSFYPFYI